MAFFLKRNDEGLRLCHFAVCSLLFFKRDQNSNANLPSQQMAEESDSEWLKVLLEEVQLLQFYVKVRDNLQITR